MCAGLALLWCFFADAASGQQMVFEVDAGASELAFSLDATLHTVHGTIKIKEGEIAFDPASSGCAGKIVADARSGNTGNRSRDANMHKSVLESEKYPEIVFLPRAVQGRVAVPGESRIELSGTMILHGQQQEVAVPVEMRVAGNQWTATGAFAVPYVKWGLKNPSTFFLRVKDSVNVSVRAAGTLSLSSGSQ